jgi:hypothetical protein
LEGTRERFGDVRTDAERKQPLQELAAREAATVIQVYKAFHFMVHVSSVGLMQRGRMRPIPK